MKPEDAKRYALYQGSQKIVENSTGVFEKIDVSKFTEGGGCFVRVTDADGKSYLDFGAGIAVFALGYHYADYDQALKDQIDKVIHTSNLFYNVPMMEAAEKLVKVIDTIEPDPELVEKYNDRYAKFAKIYPTVKGLFDEVTI